MHYSEHPHEHYIKAGKGPGAVFLGDLERWNWRYLIKGLALASAYDNALVTNFGAEQRRLMGLPPVEAMNRLNVALPDLFTEEAVARCIEAQARLFPPLIANRDENVIFVNFGRKAA